MKKKHSDKTQKSSCYRIIKLIFVDFEKFIKLTVSYEIGAGYLRRHDRQTFLGDDNKRSS